MEQEQFQKHILARVRKLEDKAFDGTFEQNYQKTPRQQSKDISNGNSPTHNIGEKSKEVLEKELQSHLQSWQETWTNETKQKWNNTKQRLIEQLRKLKK